MSREGRSARGGGREGVGSVAPQPYTTHFYPMVGYQGPPQPWYPGHPAAGVPSPWAPSWSPPMGYPAPTPPWSTQQTAPTATTTSSSSTAPIPSDEYTVDTLRRVYKDDDGRVEIQRVKVQRRHPETGALALPTGPEAMSVVPVGSVSVNERRPPPRRNRRKQQQQLQMMTPGPGQAPGPYPWYPYMPCVPYPYPYPYYFGGCMWPPGVPAASVASWSDGSERASSRQDSLPTTLDSQRLESRASPPSHVILRTPSPAGASHVTDTQSIAPSDSVSVRGRKRETSLERALRGPTPPPRTKSRASTEFKSGDVGKTQEWILEMHQALGTAPGDAASDKSVVTSAPSDGVLYKKIPPKRKRRKALMGSVSDKDSVIDQKDLDNMSDRQSVVSDVTFDESSRLSSELNYAFRKLERSVDAFKTEMSVESTPVQSPAPSPSIDFIHSSGNATPTGEDLMGLMPSDISLPLEEASKHRTEEQDQTEAAILEAIDRAISPCSVSSLPSLVAGKTGSVADVSGTTMIVDAPPAETPHSVPNATTPRPQTETGAPHTTPSDAASTPALAEATSSHPSKTPTSQSPAGQSVTHVTAAAPPPPPHQANNTTSASASASASSSDHLAQAAPTSGETAQPAPQSVTVSCQPMTVPPPAKPVTESVPSAGQPASLSASPGEPVPGGQPVSADQPVPVPAGQPAAVSAGQPAAVSAGQPAAVSEGPPSAVSAGQPVPASAGQPVPVSAGQPASSDQPVPIGHPTSAAVHSASREAAGGVGQVEAPDQTSGRDSRASSTSTFFSARPSDDPTAIVDTDSTDIPLPTTADEGGDQTDSTTAVSSDEDWQWVLQQPGETPDLAASSAAGGEDDRRNAWRAEVSLWRARLVVSLCRGRGLDRQDWATFHLLVHHPLTLDLKLSLLHAQRFCAANKAAGAALMRVGLIHLAQYGETLLQPEESRQSNWRAIKVDSSQPWAPVKGAMEILRSLGYREREEGGTLKFPRRSGPEVSVLARLTLDMLVLAEELRLYLTGTHQYPANISDLFFPAATAAPSDPHQSPAPSAGGFVSPEAPSDLRPESRASSVTDDDTETLQPSVKQVKTHTKKARRSSSSSEDVTLKEDNTNKVPSEVQAAEIAQDAQGTAPLPSTPDALPIVQKVEQLGSTASLPTIPSDRSSVSSNMTSLPDLQSIRSSSSSQQSQSLTGSVASGSTDTVTPGVTPAPAVSSDNPEEHIYEEIDVIRAQAQAVRASSVPVESGPPPLPPKKKVSSGGEDDSGLSLTYPQVEWTSASTPGSLRGGSTGARRKKRRAPMPPEFMPPDWKYNLNKQEENPEHKTGTRDGREDEKRRAEYQRSLNPFYEETPAVKGKVEEPDDSSVKSGDESVGKAARCNPFTADAVKVAGYIGKNPFYEDVELPQKTKETSASHPSLSSFKSDGSACAMGSLSELHDNSVAVRPKRRAPKPPPTPQPATPTPELPPTTQQKTEPSEKPKRPPTPEILKQAKATSPSDKTSHTEEVNIMQQVVANDTTVSMNAKTSPQIQNKDDVMDASHTTSSQAPAHPAENDSKMSPKVGDEKTVDPLQSVEVTASVNSTVEADIHTDDLEKGVKADSSNPTSRDQKNLDEENHQLNDLQDSEKTPEIGAGGKEKMEESTIPPVSKDEDNVSKTEELTQLTPKISRAAQQRMSPQHPSTPPPPPPKAEVDVAKKAPVSTPTAESPPPVLPPKAPLSILDDIPYMDANEIRYAKAKLAEQKLSQPPRNEIPEAPENTSFDVAPSVSLPTMSRSASLLRGKHIASISDESDLPPDCPPPLPPGPPPESPPTSPPETPHTSPPETPHTSPPETPHSTPRSSPNTVAPAATTDTSARQDADARKIEGDEGALKDEAPPIPPKATQLMLALVEAPVSSAAGQPVAAQSKPSQDTVQPPPELPPKATLKTSPPAQTETSASDTLDPASAKHSLQSSVSEERYEIPDTSLAPPPRPPPSAQQPSKLQTKDQTTEPYTAPSEADRYEYPEPPSEALTTPKAAEVEERYEIPEVVKEKAIKSGANGAPLKVVVGRTASLKRRELEAVFGPPKPPRRRRSHPPPPPRPPKSVTLMDGTRSLTKARTAARPPSANSSFSSTSGGTTSSVPSAPPPSQSKQKSSRLRRSWPFLFCDCMYANCRTYDDVNK